MWKTGAGAHERDLVRRVDRAPADLSGLNQLVGHRQSGSARSWARRSVRPNAGMERFRLCDEDAAFHRLDAQLIPESTRLD